MLTTILLAVAFAVVLMAVLGIAGYFFADGSVFFGFWMGMETLKAGGYILGAILTAIAESTSNG